MMKSLRGRRSPAARVRMFGIIESLEVRVVMSAAFDLTGLTDMRTDPTFAGIDGSGVGVAILDSGIYATHPDLRNNVSAVALRELDDPGLDFDLDTPADYEEALRRFAGSSG